MAGVLISSTRYMETSNTLKMSNLYCFLILQYAIG